MKTYTAIIVAAALAGGSLSQAEENKMECKLPEPTPQHAWLQKYVGEWKTEAEINMEPGKPPMKAEGTETFRMVGGFWVVGEGQSEMMGKPFASVLTLGYDAEDKEYVGTWVDSMSGHLWEYEGTLDAAGKILTLTAEGPCPMQPGKTIQFREVTEFVSDNERVFTSSMKDDDGNWVPMVKVISRKQVR